MSSSLQRSCCLRYAPAPSGDDAAALFTPDNTLQVSFIDVGQGDSELITLPDGKTILIDAGEAKTADALIRSIQSLGVGRLDYIIGTHPHADHIGGMAKVIDAFDVGAVYLPKVEHDTKTFENLLLAVKRKRA